MLALPNGTEDNSDEDNPIKIGVPGSTLQASVPSWNTEKLSLKAVGEYGLRSSTAEQLPSV